MWWVIISKLKSDVSDEPRCELIVNTTLVVCKNVVENFVAIALLIKELMVLLRRAKYNFIEQNC